MCHGFSKFEQHYVLKQRNISFYLRIFSQNTPSYMFDSVLNTLLGTFWKYELVCRSFQINLKCLANVLILRFG